MRLGRLIYLLLFAATCAFFACKKSETIPPEPPIPPTVDSTPIADTTPTIDSVDQPLPPVLLPITLDVNNAIGGYYQALPPDYDSNENKHPLIIFLHGGGGFGNGQIDLPLLLNEGIPLLLDQKLLPAEFVVNETHFSFIHLAPQFRREPTNEEVISFIDYAIAHFRIDTNRIYLTGMSNGAKITCNVAELVPEKFAAIVAMAGVSDTSDLQSRCKSIVDAKLPVWVFHNDHDQVNDVSYSINFIDAINALNPLIVPRFTIFPSEGLLGHDAWTRATDPKFKEENRNIYEWMLQYSRGNE